MNPGNYEYGLWPLMIINTAVFVLFALSFFRPKTRVDWKAFGGFSAFTVALFTEMYGVPLTLFALAPWLERHYPGINPFAHDTGMLRHTVFQLPGDRHFFHIISSLLIVFGFLLIYRSWRVLFAASQKPHAGDEWSIPLRQAPAIRRLHHDHARLYSASTSFST